MGFEMIFNPVVGIISLFFGLIFRNSLMQIIGGAILIYMLATLHIIPAWFTAVLVMLFIFLLVGGKK